LIFGCLCNHLGFVNAVCACCDWVVDELVGSVEDDSWELSQASLGRCGILLCDDDGACRGRGGCLGFGCLVGRSRRILDDGIRGGVIDILDDGAIRLG